MLKSITATNYVGDSLEIELGNPEKSGFLITSITGLSSPKATINTTDVPTNDGSVYNSSRLGNRNITITMRILDNPSIEKNCQTLYKIFPSKRRLKIRFLTDYNRDVYAIGYVESNQIDHFSKAVTSTISIVCPDPYFYDEDTQYVVFGNSDNEMEFPIETEIYTTNEMPSGKSSETVRREHRIQNAAIALIDEVIEPERDPQGVHSIHGIFESTDTIVYWLNCLPDTKYAIRKQNGDRLRVATSKTKPTTYDETDVRLYSSDDSMPDAYTFTTATDAKYMIINPYSRGNGSEVESWNTMEISKVVNNICLSDVYLDTVRNIMYDGEIESGCIIRFIFVGTVSNLKIYNITTQEVMSVNYTFVRGDELVINTINNQKSIKIFKNGTYTSILNKLSRDSDWFVLNKGDNMFAYSADGQANAYMTIETTVLYEGL